MKKKLNSVESQREGLSTARNVLLAKLKNAKQLAEKVEEMESKPAFMTEEEVSEERLRIQIKLEKPLEIIAAISKLELEPDHLNHDQIRTLQKKIQSLKSSLKREDGANSHPDLECIICQSLPEPQEGNLHVYSCSKHHLLCQDCLSRVEKCPMCEENFTLLNAQRNHLAERMILQLKNNQREQSDKDVDFETGIPTLYQGFQRIS